MILGVGPLSVPAALLDAALATASSTISGARHVLASLGPALTYQQSVPAEGWRTELRCVSTVTGIRTRLDVEPSAGSPRWSPRGRELAFTAASGGTSRLVLWRPGAGPPVAVPDSDGASSCCWSPGGERLAFSRFGGGIHLINRDGTGRVAVAAGPEDRSPDWSADGRWLVYSSGFADGSNITVLDLETGVRSAVTPVTPEVFDRGPRHRPGDTTLVFSRGRFDGGARLWTVGLDGGAPRPLTASVLPFRDETDPAFSPDGRALAFVRTDPDNARSWVHLADAEVRHVVRVTGGDGRVSTPEWTP